MLFEMLVGGPPFYHENVQIMYRMIEEEDIPMPEKYLPPTGRDLLSKLLQRNPSKRLGFGDTGSEDIQKHKFFSSINWDALYKKELAPPFKPNVTGDDDVSNVAQEFLDEAVVDLEGEEAPAINKAEQAEFDSFKQKQ